MSPTAMDAGADVPFPERAMGRATASTRIDGNRISLQFDGPSTFDAWLEAIAGARRFIHFENYIIRDDPQGHAFRDALVERARAGVQVRVLYDWMGCWATPRRFWRSLREAGVEVRAFNPPALTDPMSLLQRDHRKLVVVDGAVAFIGGFCVGQEWAGTHDRPPWRDTGVEIRGPAAAAAARTFERVWADCGGVVSPEAQSDPETAERKGDSLVWLIEGVPWRLRAYRATQLMASVATHRVWITDPYFLAPRPVAEALMAAARDGVDVRVLVPAHNNWPWVGSLSRGGYRALLEAGVRIFEWEGPMIHAKTLVVDGRFSRIGSTNLNSASLLGNWELDVGILDPDLAAQVEGLFLADLASAMEIVLPGRAGTPSDTPGETGWGTATLDPPTSLQERGRLAFRVGRGGKTLTLADVVRGGSALGDAIAGRRVVGREARAVLSTVSVLLLAFATVAGFFPRAVGWALAVIFGWIGIALTVRSGVQVWKARQRGGEAEP
ncbi:MAG: cardiolipin synthase B [Gemmatimonadetes bacterium]|nr:cardiolipin synthase B [Gemmatimonadota bacterium]